MKYRKSLLWLLTLCVLLAALTLPAFAADTGYSIPMAGLDVSLPSDYIIVVSDLVPQCDDNDQYDAETDMYLYGVWADNGVDDFILGVCPQGTSSLDYQGLNAVALEIDAAEWQEVYEEKYGALLESGIYTTAYTQYVYFRYLDSDGDYYKTFITAHNGYYTVLEVLSFGRDLSLEADEILMRMIDNTQPVAAAPAQAAETTPEPAEAGVQGDGHPLMPVDPSAQTSLLGPTNSEEPAVTAPTEDVMPVTAPTPEIPEPSQEAIAPVEPAAPSPWEQEPSATPSPEPEQDEDKDDSGKVMALILVIVLIVLVIVVLVVMLLIQSQKRSKSGKSASGGYTPAAPPVDYGARESTYRAPVGGTMPAEPPMPAGRPPVEEPPHMNRAGDLQPAKPLEPAPRAPEPPQKFCPHCGAPVKAGSAFCGKCGSKL